MILLAGITFSVTSCNNEEDDIFDSSAAHRLDQAALESGKALYDSPTGWAMEYYPTNDAKGFRARGYLMLAKFNSNYSVDMAMKNVFSGNAFIESSSAWDVVTDNGPVLTFNTYNDCIHRFSAPEDLSKDITGTEDDEQGLGAMGDYEFVVVDAAVGAETIMLKGKKRDTYVRLTRVDADIDYSTYLTNIDNFVSKYFNASAPNMPIISIGDSLMYMRNPNGGLSNVYGVNADYILDEKICPYLITIRDGKYYLRFRSAIEAGGSNEQEFVFNEEADRFEGLQNASNTIAGESPVSFFNSAMVAGNSWQFARATSKSDDFQQAYVQLMDNFKAVGYTLSGFVFINTDGRSAIRLNYRSGYNSRNAVFYFNTELTEKGQSFVYDAPRDDNAAKLAKNVEGLEEFFAMLSNDYAIESVGTSFNQSGLVLKVDEDTWINVSFNK